MGFDVDRSPPAARTALRYVEDAVHGVRRLVVRRSFLSDPLEYLIRTHRANHRDGDARALRHGYEVAERLHRGQWRKSGEAYITHPLAVAQILAELGMDTTTLVAALLHDTVEDTSYTMPQLRAEFGGEVAQLVDGVTKFDRVFYGEDAEAETIRKMMVTAGNDVRVLIVKLADRLHNMRTIEARSTASRVRIARATQDVLIPLCERLGIQVLKRELEDSVLAALEPAAHAELGAWVAHRPEWTAYTDAFIAQAQAVLKSAKIRARVISRPHHLYTIWADTYANGRTDPHELPRILVVVNGAENDCYTALGEVHSAWRPVIGRFKDFIASPKNNLYRSLHTSVIGPEGRAIEVLIRTEDMNTSAEFGIAAAYRAMRRGPGAHRSGGAARGQRRSTLGPDHLDWLHNLVRWQRGAMDPLRFLESLRCDLAEGQVHVFVEGRRMLLPAHATPVDVAYALGTEVGDRCVAATVNGQLAFLSSPLADGDVVEIHTVAPDGVEAAGPSPEWLTFVRTPRAQLEISRHLRQTYDDPETAPPLPAAARARIGRAAVTLALRERERRLVSDLPLLNLAYELGYPDLESMCVAICDHVLPAGEVADRLIDKVDGAVSAALASGGTAALAS